MEDNYYVLYSSRTNKYIKIDKNIPATTDSIQYAHMFSYKGARNLLECGFPKTIKNLGPFNVYGYNIQTGLGSIIMNGAPVLTQAVVKDVAKSTPDTNIVVKTPPVNGPELQSLNRLKELNRDMSELLSKSKTLNVSLSVVDKEIVDLEHYIELSYLNAAEGYKAFKMLQDKLIQRRHIKDQMDIINQMAAKGMNFTAFGDIINYIEQLETRCYYSRTNILETIKGESYEANCNA